MPAKQLPKHVEQSLLRQSEVELRALRNAHAKFRRGADTVYGSHIEITRALRMLNGISGTLGKFDKAGGINNELNHARKWVASWVDKLETAARQMRRAMEGDANDGDESKRAGG